MTAAYLPRSSHLQLQLIGIRPIRSAAIIAHSCDRKQARYPTFITGRRSFFSPRRTGAIIQEIDGGGGGRGPVLLDGWHPVSLRPRNVSLWPESETVIVSRLWMCHYCVQTSAMDSMEVDTREVEEKNLCNQWKQPLPCSPS